MVGILIIAHGTLGESLIQCVSHVMGGRPPQLMQIGVGIHDEPQQILRQAQQLLLQLDQGEGVLVLSDIYGATPCNIACRLLEAGRIEGVAGVSLPMLVRALTYNKEPLAKVMEKAMSGGHEGVVLLPTEARDYAAAGG